MKHRPKPPHWRIRCPGCSFIRVHFRENLCRRCWTDGQPAYRVVRLKGGVTRRIGSAKVALQQGRARGAETLHATGKAHKWDPATARAAALKMWRQRPVNKHVNWRLGKRIRSRPTINHAAIRAVYQMVDWSAVWYGPGSRPNEPGHWHIKTETGSRIISERAALIRLGYLPNPRNFVPRIVDPIGTTYAKKGHK